MKLSKAFLFLLLACAPLTAIPMELADKYLEKHSSRETLLQALETYENHLKQNPPTAEILWRYSATCHFLAIRFSAEEAKKELYDLATQKAKEAYLLDDNCAPCHFWYAINLALLGEERGVFSMISNLPKAKKHLMKVTELDAHYAIAGAYRVLGSIYWKLPGILGGDNELAEKYLKLAVQKEPQLLNYLFLSKFYAEEVGDKKQALSLATTALTQSRNEEVIENIESKKELQDLVQNLKKTSPQP